MKIEHLLCKLTLIICTIIIRVGIETALSEGSKLRVAKLLAEVTRDLEDLSESID